MILNSFIFIYVVYHFSILESQHLGLPNFVLKSGAVGVVLSGNEDGLPQVICWPHQYSAWHLFALITASINFIPGIGIGKERLLVGTLYASNTE